MLSWQRIDLRQEIDKSVLRMVYSDSFQTFLNFVRGLNNMVMADSPRIFPKSPLYKVPPNPFFVILSTATKYNLEEPQSGMWCLPGSRLEKCLLSEFVNLF